MKTWRRLLLYLLLLSAAPLLGQFQVKNSSGSVLIHLTQNGILGIATTTPDAAARVDINGKAKMSGLQVGTGTTAGYALVATATGDASWSQLGAIGIANQAINSSKLATSNTPSSANQVLSYDGANMIWNTAAGDIAGVTAGNGLTGGGTSGTVTVDVGAGTGITVAADAVSINQTTTDGWYVNEGQASSITSSMITDLTVVNADIADNTIAEPKLAIGNTAANGQVLGWNGSQMIWTTAAGDIAGVTAGNGLTGGGTSGTVTVDVGAGTGITVAADAVSINQTTTDGWYVNEGQASSITSSMITDGVVSSSDVADNSLTATDLSVNVVSSLDGVTNDGGNIDLLSSGSITITPDDANNRITIGSTSPSGSGTVQRIPLWTSSSTLGNSAMFQGGSAYPSYPKIGINTTNPAVGALHVRSTVVGGTGNYGSYISEQVSTNSFMSGLEIWKALESGGNPQIMQNGYPVGGIFWNPYFTYIEKMYYSQITDYVNTASIYSVISGTVTTDVCPTDMIFAIGYDGNGLGTTEAMRIKSNGNVCIGSTTSNSKKLYVNGDCQITGTLSKGAGSFDIPHPDPRKSNYRLRHSFVESPTRGENLYRYQVRVQNRSAIITLPDYFRYLNENAQVWISPVKHFGAGYGEVNENQTEVAITANEDGLYNVLVVATRKDKIAKDYFDPLGVEYIPDQTDRPNGGQIKAQQMYPEEARYRIEEARRQQR